MRSISTDGISEAERCEFDHATAAPIFGSLEIKFLSDQALNGSFQLTTSTRFANVSELVHGNGPRRSSELFAILAHKSNETLDKARHGRYTCIDSKCLKSA